MKRSNHPGLKIKVVPNRVLIILTQVSSSTTDGTWVNLIATVASLVVTACLGPVVIAWAKGRSKNMNYAWDTARDTQRQLIEGKNQLINSLMDDIDELQEKLESYQKKTYDAEKKALVAEQEKLALVRRLLEYEDVTGHGKRRRRRRRSDPDNLRFPD